MRPTPSPTVPSDGPRSDSGDRRSDAGDRKSDAGVIGPLCVAPTDCVGWWPHVERMIASALCRGNGGTPLAEVRDDLLAGRALLWVAWSPSEQAIIGAAVTAIVVQGSERRCELVAFAGELDRCRAMLPALERNAAAEGCSAMRIIGRSGWRRRLAGYAEPFVVLEKRL
jgi:hypothetical protein